MRLLTEWCVFAIFTHTTSSRKPHHNMCPHTLPQRPDIASIVTAIRVSLAHAYYGTPPYAIPFTMALPKALHTPLPAMDGAAHQVFISAAVHASVDHPKGYPHCTSQPNIRHITPQPENKSRSEQQPPATHARHPRTPPSPVPHIALLLLSR